MDLEEEESELANSISAAALSPVLSCAEVRLGVALPSLRRKGLAGLEGTRQLH